MLSTFKNLHLTIFLTHTLYIQYFILQSQLNPFQGQGGAGVNPSNVGQRQGTPSTGHLFVASRQNVKTPINPGFWTVGGSPEKSACTERTCKLHSKRLTLEFEPGASHSEARAQKVHLFCGVSILFFQCSSL